MTKKERYKIEEIYKRLKKEGKERKVIIEKIANELWFQGGNLLMEEYVDEAERFFWRLEEMGSKEDEEAEQFLLDLAEGIDE